MIRPVSRKNVVIYLTDDPTATGLGRYISPILCRHNGRDGVSNHDYLLSRSFRRRSKKTSKLRVTGLCDGNSPVTGEFPSQRASNAENVSIWWRHNAITGAVYKRGINLGLAGSRSSRPENWETPRGFHVKLLFIAWIIWAIVAEMCLEHEWAISPGCLMVPQLYNYMGGTSVHTV